MKVRPASTVEWWVGHGSGTHSSSQIRTNVHASESPTTPAHISWATTPQRPNVRPSACSRDSIEARLDWIDKGSTEGLIDGLIDNRIRRLWLARVDHRLRLLRQLRTVGYRIAILHIARTMPDPVHIYMRISPPTDRDQANAAITTIMTTTAVPDLDPAHWRYLAEGKLHVVVAFDDSGGGAHESPAPSRFQHHALRLLKERHPDAARAASALYDAAREQAYLERVVGPALGVQYVDLGWTVPVTRAFLEGVAARCVVAQLIMERLDES